MKFPYEFHITFDATNFHDAHVRLTKNLQDHHKVHYFDLLRPDGTIVERHLMITAVKEFYGLEGAVEYAKLAEDVYKGLTGVPIARSKIETVPWNQENQALYFEAHVTAFTTKSGFVRVSEAIRNGMLEELGDATHGDFAMAFSQDTIIVTNDNWRRMSLLVRWGPKHMREMSEFDAKMAREKFVPEALEKLLGTKGFACAHVCDFEKAVYDTMPSLDQPWLDAWK